MASRLKIRRDDQVIVTSGKDRGKTGKVLRVDPKAERVFVEGLNIVKRHSKPRPGTSDPGGVVEKEGPIHISNVMLLDPQDNKPTRVSISREDGKRFRVARASGKKLD
jgi:large subunit ribosomal protein L24